MNTKSIIMQTCQAKREFFLRIIAMAAAAIGILASCSSVPPHHPVPENLVDHVRIPGFSTTVRTWGDALSPEFVNDFTTSREQTIAYYRAHPEESHPAHIDILTLSGGGERGAFGAGLLCGWTQRGDRPEFRLVTGVSTGALIAPFAFLGPSYDQKLKDGYTNIDSADIFTSRNL